jgi:hypothetical protein
MSGNTYIYNHIFLIPDDYNLSNIKEKSNSIFRLNQNFHSIKTYNSQTKFGNIFIIKDMPDQLSVVKSINLEISNRQKPEKPEIKEDIPTKITDISESSDKSEMLSIEIKNVDAPNKKQYFIINDKKRIGRKPKSSNIRAVHTKFSYDNILRKIKVKFVHKLINYINKIILAKYSKRVKLLKKLTGSISQNNTIKYNQKLLKSRLKEIFIDNEINGKYKLVDKDYNQKVIEKIYEENITELIEILETTFLDAFNIFRDIKCTQKLVGFEKIDKVIDEMNLKEKNEEYINKFRDVVMNFEKHYFEKNGRT